MRKWMIGFSGNAAYSNRREDIKNVFNMFLRKPVHFEDFIAALNETIGNI